MPATQTATRMRYYAECVSQSQQWPRERPIVRRRASAEAFFFQILFLKRHRIDCDRWNGLLVWPGRSGLLLYGMNWIQIEYVWMKIFLIVCLYVRKHMNVRFDSGLCQSHQYRIVSFLTINGYFVLFLFLVFLWTELNWTELMNTISSSDRKLRSRGYTQHVNLIRECDGDGVLMGTELLWEMMLIT